MLARIAFCFLCFSLSAGFVSGQTTFSTITGTATDSSGLPVPNVQIEVTEAATGFRFTTATNQAGIYTLNRLLSGTYALHARREGFKEFVQEQIQLYSQEIRTVNIRLQLGAVAESVVVSGTVAPIETETPQITNTMTGADLNLLPSAGRQLQHYLQFNPAVLGTSTDRFRFGGSLDNQTQWTLDGTSASNFRSNNYGSGVMGQMYVESLAEVRVQLGTSPAEFSALGGVSAFTKSGTNRLHGSLFDYYSDSKFGARNPFSLSKGATYISHLPGFSAGGPVYVPGLYNGRNKTFFFACYETAKGSRTTTVLNPTVPTIPWRSGDFSTLATPIRDPLADNTVFPGNRIPAARLNPVAKQIQDQFYPLPNYGDPGIFASQNYRDIILSPFQPRYNVSARVDHQVNEKLLLWSRVALARVQSLRPDGASGVLGTAGMWHRVLKEFAFAFASTYTFRPTLINEFRYNLASDDSPANGSLNGKEWVEKLGFVGLAPDLPDITGLPTVAFSGLGITTLTIYQYHNPYVATVAHEFQDQVSWFHGRHTVKTGVLLSFGNYDDYTAPTSLFGNLTFSNRFTGHAYADFILGIPTTVSRAFDPPKRELRRSVYNFFVSDSFKVSSRLTLELGLRYELLPNWNARNGLLAIFDVDAGKIVVPNGSLSKVSSLFPSSYVGIVETKDRGLPNTLLKTDTNNWAPRLGFAWRPFGNRSVLRGGFGVYYDQTPVEISSNSSPFVLTEPAYTNPSPNPTVILPRVFPTLSTGGPGTVGLPSAVRADLRIPFSMQYTLTLEREMWGKGFRLSYVGTNSRQGLWNYNINAPVPDTRLFVDKARRFPNFPAIPYNSNGAGHQYHSLTAQVSQRYNNGLEYQGSYVWSRDIGNTEYRTAENPYDRQRDRGPSSENPAHRVTAFVTYDLPFGKGRPFMKNPNRVMQAFFGGWQISNFFAAQTGTYLTPMWTGPDPTGTAYTSSRTPAQVTIRPDRIRDGNLPADQRSVAAWYDLGAFTAPRTGSFGTSAPGVIRGPGLYIIKSRLAKTFHLWEQLQLQFRVSTGNLFNHPNYSSPEMNITSGPNAARITAVGGVSAQDGAGTRGFRFDLRLEW
jgi:hypothetical protein